MRDPGRSKSADAVYAHGFLRIIEAFLEPLLQFSGTDGMYIVPRTSARTVDPTYKVITFPGFGLEDAKRQRDLLDDVAWFGPYGQRGME